MKIIMLGDSITAGMTEGGAYVSRPLATIIADETGYEVTNAGISMTQVVAGNNPFVQVVNHYNFADYDMAMIMYGTNDFGWQDESIDEFKNGLHQGIDKIERDNSKIQIRLMTPIQDFDRNIDNGSGNMDWNNRDGLSQNDFCNAVVQVAKDYNFEVYDWRDKPVVTKPSLLASDGIHPLQSTYNLMGQALSVWLKKTSQATDWDTNYREITNLFILADECNERLTVLYGKMRALYKAEEKYFDDDTQVKLEMLPVPQTPILDRAVRNWLIKSLLKLERDVNDLVKAFNEDSFTDPTTGDDTDLIKLTIPRQLLLDTTFQDELNHSLKSVNDLLNRLYSYMKQNTTIGG